MRLAERARTCPACGRSEPPGARWCGDCGSPLGGARLSADGDTAAADAPGPGSDRQGTRWGWLAVVVVVVAVASVLVDPAPTGDTALLGRLDDATGRSSLLPPHDGLQLLWRRSVDAAGAAPSGPPALTDLTGGQVLLGGEVVDLATGAVVVDVAAAGPVDPAAHPVLPDGRGRVVVVDGRDLLVTDVRTGRVVSRAPLAPGPWSPSGAALGWVAGAAVLADADGVLGAVEPTGEVRWVGEPGWSWDGTGHDTDWLVVRRRGADGEQVLAVDGRDGTVALELGPAEAVHAPVVHGDTAVWVDPLRGVDRGLGHPVQVRGARLGGAGGQWEARHLSPTSGRPTAVRVTAVGDSVVVHYWATGDSTAAVWLDPSDGRQVGVASGHGSGRTAEGWPLTAVVDGGLVHVDRVAQRLRLVDRSGDEQWSTPASPGEGVVAHGQVVLVRTPPRGTSLQSRLRMLDAATGEVLWDHVVDSTQQQRLVGVLGGHVGVASGGWQVPLHEQSWFALDTGRRRAGPGLAAEALGAPLPADGELVLLGSVASEEGVRPVLLLTGADGPGRIIGPEPSGVAPTVASLLGAPNASGGPIGTVADDALVVTVGAGSVVAHDPRTGDERWRVLPSVALQAEHALLLDEVVVTLGVDGGVRAWDRRDGTPRWQGPAVGTALSAGGDAVVLGTGAGEVVVLDADGVVQQRVSAGRDPVEDVAVVGGRVLVTVGQDLVAFGRGMAVVEPDDRIPLP